MDSKSVVVTSAACGVMGWMLDFEGARLVGGEDCEQARALAKEWDQAAVAAFLTTMTRS